MFVESGMYPYRVFVSYSSEDRPLAKKLVAHLENINLHPVWDANIKHGERFSDIIKHGIAHAHVFMPILTKKSAKRPWVHQETGYAMGLDVPILPIAVGRLPGEMLQDLHAMTVKPDFSDLAGDTLGRDIENLLTGDRRESEATFRAAPLPEMRAEFLARYAREALAHEAHGPLRQAGALSSFCLPREPADDEIWRERDGLVAPRSELLYGYLREERLALEDYVKKNGCALVIYPGIQLTRNGPKARRVRLSTLLDFLTDETIKNVRVAVRKRMTAGNLTIAGDWFSAESATPRAGKGYHQTFFTWHAPTVIEKVRKFDRDFELLLKKQGVTADSSREAAIEAVQTESAAIKG